MSAVKRIVTVFTIVGAAFGVFAETSLDYVKDGLVAQWDGIENADVGRHEPSPTVWKDLVGGLEITIPAWVTVETNAFYSESSTDATRPYPTIASIPGLGDSVTIEVVGQRVRWRAADDYGNLQYLIRSPYGSVGYRLNASNGAYYHLASGGQNPGIYNLSTAGLDVTGVHTYSALVNRLTGESNTVKADGMDYWWTQNGSLELPTEWVFFNAKRADVRIFAIRVYSRRLTDVEIEKNAEVDHLRFVEGKTGGFWSEIINVGTNRADVVWQASADMTSPVAARFVSGLKPDLSDGVVRELGSFARDAVVTAAVAFVRGATTYWRIETEDADGRIDRSGSRLMPLFAFDSREYATAGLVAQWDGIENAGRGVRSPAPTVWKDLVGSNDITLPDWVRVVENGFESIGSTAARTYPTLASIPGLEGDDATVEVAARCIRWTDTGDVHQTQPVARGPWGAFGYRNNLGNGFYAFLPPGANDTSKMLIYNSTPAGVRVADCQTLSICSTRNSLTAKNVLNIGGSPVPMTLDGNGSPTDLPTGWTFFNNARTDIGFYAIRIYNRRLSARELAMNAWTDRLRLAGVVDETQVLTLQVRYDGEGASCRTGYACWPIPDETCRCEAENSVPDGDFASICVGWTLMVETDYEVWSEEARGVGCQMSYQPDGRRRRLVWHTVRSRTLPSEYVWLDCLEAHGNQMIDTGYSPHSKTVSHVSVRFSGSFSADASTVRTILGTPLNADGLQYACNFGGTATGNREMYFWTRYSYAKGGNPEIKNITFDASRTLERHTISIFLKDGGVEYAGVGGSCNKRAADQTQPETVRLCGGDNPFTGYETMYLYGATFFDDTTLRRDFVPVRSVATGARGLYDYVTGEFRTNIVAGAEDFTGAAVGIHVDGDPLRLGEPSIPYGVALPTAGTLFELSETNVVKTTGQKLCVKSIARYAFDETTGRWTFAERTRGSSVTATYTGAAVRYVLEWRPRGGLAIVVR